MKRFATLMCVITSVLLVACLYLAGYVSAEVAAISGCMVGTAFMMKDDLLRITRALPNGIATVASTGFDLGHGTRGAFLTPCELLIESPALTTAQLPDTKTIIYDVYHDTASDFSSETLLFSAVLTQTGAQSAGAAAASVQRRLPAEVKRYVRVKASNSGSGNASTVSATLSLVF